MRLQNTGEMSVYSVSLAIPARPSSGRIHLIRGYQIRLRKLKLRKTPYFFVGTARLARDMWPVEPLNSFPALVSLSIFRPELISDAHNHLLFRNASDTICLSYGSWSSSTAEKVSELSAGHLRLAEGEWQIAVPRCCSAQPHSHYGPLCLQRSPQVHGRVEVVGRLLSVLKK